MLQYLTFTTEKDAVIALNQIDVDMNLPMNDESGYVALTWDLVKKSKSGDLWYFLKPEISLENIVNYQISYYDPAWKEEPII